MPGFELFYYYFFFIIETTCEAKHNMITTTVNISLDNLTPPLACWYARRVFRVLRQYCGVLQQGSNNSVVVITERWISVMNSEHVRQIRYESITCMMIIFYYSDFLVNIIFENIFSPIQNGKKKKKNSKYVGTQDEKIIEFSPLCTFDGDVIIL